jgi:hypothetical protein
MSVYKIEKRNEKGNSMLNKKTNEDHNRQKPNPFDPNQMENNIIVENDIKPKKNVKNTTAKYTTSRKIKEKNELHESDYNFRNKDQCD